MKYARLAFTYARQRWPLIAALAALYTVVIRWVILSTGAQDGRLVYALDDPYIHMAIAKNLALHGVWGITRYESSAASSSPVWTLLLAAIYRVVGPNVIAPFLLNVLCATLALGLIYAIFRRYDLPPLFSLAALLAITFLTPLPTLIFTGQEHILHFLLTIAFSVLAIRLLLADRVPRRTMILFAGLAMILPLVRYEALFMIAVAGVLLILRGRWLRVLLLAASAVTPVLIYGQLTVMSGGFWFPNSIMLKSRLSAANSLGGAVDPTTRLFKFEYLKLFYFELFASTMLHITLLVVAALILYAIRSLHRRDTADERGLMLILFAGGALLHLRLASLGWFYRYEAYVAGWGLFVLALALGEYVGSGRNQGGAGSAPTDSSSPVPPSSLRARVRLTNALLARIAAGSVVGIAFGFPLFQRGWNAYHETLAATRNIYAQQVHMAEFIRQYYDHDVVALNDVGAASYLTDAHILDLWGLGSNEVAHDRYQGFYDTYTMERLGYDHEVKIAIVYPQSFEQFGGLPASWVKVGEWTIPGLVAVANPTVTFYAIDLAEINPLALHMQAFAPELSPGTQVRLYVQPLQP